MFKVKLAMEEFHQSSFQIREVEDDWSQVHWISKPQTHIHTNIYIIGNIQNGIFDGWNYMCPGLKIQTWWPGLKIQTFLSNYV